MVGFYMNMTFKSVFNLMYIYSSSYCDGTDIAYFDLTAIINFTSVHARKRESPFVTVTTTPRRHSGV